MTIRKVDDYMTLAEMYHASFIEQKNEISRAERIALLAQFPCWVDSRSPCYTLAAFNAEGKAQGFAVVSTGPRNLARRLIWLHVFKPNRQRGVGSSLVYEVLARHRHVQVACSRDLMIFYEPLGFPLWGVAQNCKRGDGDVVGFTTKTAKKRGFSMLTPLDEAYMQAAEADAVLMGTA